MLNWMFFCSFVVSFALTIVGLLMDVTYQIQLAPRVEKFQSYQLKRLPDYLRLKKRLETHPIFNPQLGRGENFQNLWKDLTNRHENKKLLSLKEKKVIMAMGEDWLDQKHKIKLPPVAVDLFANIYDYSHWESSIPMDAWDASDLIVSGQLYLAHTLHFEPLNIRESLKRVRHLALILLSMEDMNFKRAGLSLLEKEQTFTRVLDKKILDSELLWAPVSLAELRDFRHYMKQTSGMLSYLSSPQVLNNVYLKGSPPTGFCSVMREKNRILSWSRSFLNSNFPFEPSFQERLDLIDQIRQRGQEACLPLPKLKPESKGQWVTHIPYYRRLYAIKMLLDANKVSEPL